MSAQPLRILIIEDNRDQARTLMYLMELCGHQARVAYTGPEGIHAACAWHPDVVLCDIGLPELNGWEVARTLRHHADTAAARLIAITAYSTEADRRRSQEAGFECHLVKPVDVDILESLLSAHC
jgi:CheY-like chemotaxis protein